MSANLEEYLYVLPEDVLLDILRIILIRLGHAGLAGLGELRLLVSIEDWKDTRARKVA